ncbi:MAG: hypothetical protein EOO70_07575 [Myxococcaceae bacterium]|nr:MAG: hypothetical protein EOO70_07575 [Myxococcaceae bacterium]
MRTHHRTTPRRLAAAAITLTALLGLAACGEELIEPKPLETLSSSPTPTPTTPAAPELPDAATKPGAKGAEAFVRHYVRLINFAQRTGDTSALESASALQCESCSKGVKYVRDIYEAGGSISGGEMRTP